MMTSRGRPGDCAIENSVAGHTISRSLSEPARNRTCGRVSPKWKNSSGSISANFRAPQAPARKRAAVVAASAASFQPLNARSMTGRRTDSGGAVLASVVGCPGGGTRLTQIGSEVPG